VRALHPEEPAAHFEPGPVEAFAGEVRARLRPGRSLVLVDGRSGGGKTTVATLLGDALPAAVVHTDDVAWNESATEWDHLLVDGVLEPWRTERAVSYRPPAWVAHDRPGAIKVAANADVLVVEGVGAGRASLAARADVLVWVQSDRVEARRRGVARDASYGTRTPAEAEAFWDDWMTSEEPFLAVERPWARADLVVNGTPSDRSSGVLEWAAGPLT
jgi:uridine kinase